MSCYKCGKDLPAGEVECEPHCGSQPPDKLPDVALADVQVIQWTIALDTPKIKSDRAAFQRSMELFSRYLCAAMTASGMEKFAKRS